MTNDNTWCQRCGKWAGAHATLPGQPTDHLCVCTPPAAPVAAALPDLHTRTLMALLDSCEAWEPDVRILGNVRAEDAADAIRSALAGAVAAPSGVPEPHTDHIRSTPGGAAFLRVAGKAGGVPADMVPSAPAPVAMTPEPTDEQIEFALNNQMEDPSDDEASGFHAGARWAISFLRARTSQ